MLDDFDPRDSDDDVRDIEMPWVELGRGPGSDREGDDPRDRADDIRDRDRAVRERDHDPRDVFLHDLELPRRPEREVVVDGDDAVHFPDFRIECELDGRDQHEDVEIVTEHYRGAHAANVARAGFTCYGRGGGSGRIGGRGFDPRVAEDFI